MAFGGATCPEGHVIRSFRVKVMTTEAKHRRALELLVAAGDALAWVIDRFHERQRSGLPNANSLSELWVDQKLHGPFGQLSAHCAQDVTKHWSQAFFEAVKRKKKGEVASLPLKKHHRVAVRFRRGEFCLSPSLPGRRARVELSTRRGTENLVVALSGDHPYNPGCLREVRLGEEGGELFLDITAWVRSPRPTRCPGSSGASISG